MGNGNKTYPTKSNPTQSTSIETKEDEILEIKKITPEIIPSFKIEDKESKIVHSLGDIENEQQDIEVPIVRSTPNLSSLIRRSNEPYLSIGHTVSSKTPETIEETKPNPQTDDDSISKNAAERVNKLKNLSINLRSHEKIAEYENEPAYIRKKVQLDDKDYSAESSISRFTLGEDSKNQPVIKSDNSFLHDNVD